jgi:hypothetical protein
VESLKIDRFAARTTAALSIRHIEHSTSVLAEEMRSGCPAIHPSPKKSLGFRIATTASLPKA